MSAHNPFHLLLIEDSLTMQAACREKLTDAGMTVDVASTAEEGKVLLDEALQQDALYDGVLLDWLLPAMSGGELLEIIGSDHRFDSLPVMIFTESPDDLAYKMASARFNTDIQHKSDLPRLGYRMCKFLKNYSEREKKSAPSLEQELPDRGTKEGKILLVDDSPTICAIYSDLLHSNGYQVDAANSMEEALVMAQQDRNYQLAIVDYYMPGGNGDEFCKSVLSDPNTSHIAVVIHTQSTKVVEASLRSGAIDVIWKEDSNEIFLMRIASIMRTLNLQRQSDELSGLLSATKSLGVGLIESSVYRPFNDVMEQFAESCGGIHHFITDKFQQITLKDNEGVNRAFSLYPAQGVGEGNMVLVQEITEMIEALKQAELSQAKDEFLATMSHELRTPLTSIIGNSEILSESQLSQDQQQLLHSVEVSSKNLLLLVNDVMDVSKIESGKFEIDYAPYDLAVMVDEVEQMVTVNAQKKADLHFETTLLVQPNFQIWGDGRRVGQILINLLGNAIKFTDQGSVSLRVWVEQNRLHFSVEDTGIGMSADMLERLFKPFEQADNSISRRYGGTGLGLHISRLLAQEMDGTIEVSSTFGEGASFVLTLPYKESELPLKQLESKKLSDSEVAPLGHYSGDVLLAEDSPELQLLVKRILESMGAAVTIVDNGKTAVEKAGEQRFDLILMDMQMPVMSGIEATRELRRQGNTVPVVALTANVMQQHQDKFMESGADGFLQKPIDRVELMSVLAKYLAPAEASLLPAVPLVDTAPSKCCDCLLMVDDESSVLELYQTIFGSEDDFAASMDQISELAGVDTKQSSNESEGKFNLTLASQGDVAVEQARVALQQGRPFPVAFIDMRMPPGMDGLKTALALRELDERIYIVFVTAYSDVDPNELDKALGYGVLYLEKPFSHPEIQQIARMLTNNWRRDRKLDQSLCDVKDKLKNSLQKQKAVDEPSQSIEQNRLDDSLKRSFSGKILVAEDAPEMQLLVRRIIEKLGYQVDVADNGQEAVNRATQNHYDLILMDMQMPLMDGIEATQALRSMGNATPIVALTANVIQKYRNDFMEAGADDFLGKPLHIETLNKVLNTYVRPLSAIERREQDRAEVFGVGDDLRMIFLKSIEQKKDKLTAALISKDWSAVRDVAHMIKGSGTSFGFPLLSEQAGELQQKIDDGQIDEITNLVAELVDEIGVVLDDPK